MQTHNELEVLEIESNYHQTQKVVQELLEMRSILTGFCEPGPPADALLDCVNKALSLLGIDNPDGNE